MKKKIIRVVASPVSLDLFLREQMVYFSERYDVVGVASPGKEHERVRSSGIRSEQINIERPICPWEDLKSLWRLFCFFKKEKPWMVHSITPKAGLLSMTAAWMAGVPVRVHTFTGLLFPWKKGVLKLILKTTDRLTCLFATHINPEGFSVKKQLEESKITWRPLTVLGKGHINGVDLKRFSPHGKRDEMRARIGAESSATVFAFSGRLVKDKGIVELQKAFEKLLHDYPNTYLLLIGEEEPELDPLPQGCVEWLKSCSHVYLTGHVDNVPEWLEASDIFVFPSHREGVPTALLEAGAMGLPIIASDICGCTEIIEHARNGIIIPSCNENVLFDTLVSSLSNHEFFSSMARQVKQDVTDYWNNESVRENLSHFYAALGESINP